MPFRARTAPCTHYIQSDWIELNWIDRHFYIFVHRNVHFNNILLSRHVTVLCWVWARAQVQVRVRSWSRLNYLFPHEHLSALFYCHRSPDAQHWFVCCDCFADFYRGNDDGTLHRFVYAFDLSLSLCVSLANYLSFLHSIERPYFETEKRKRKRRRNQAKSRYEFISFRLLRFDAIMPPVCWAFILCMGRQNYKRKIAPQQLIHWRSARDKRLKCRLYAFLSANFKSIMIVPPILICFSLSLRQRSLCFALLRRLFVHFDASTNHSIVCVLC